MSAHTQKFKSLLESYCASLGLEVHDLHEALDFESDDLSVRVSLDPRQSSRLMVQVVCGSLDEELDSHAEASIALVLHRINNVARIEHDWVITVDPSRAVRIHHQSDMAQTTLIELENLMSQATERGKALRQILHQLQSVAQTPSTNKALSDNLLLQGMLRG
jgi:hypothetical protein